jgi:hypothetical protein
MWSAHVGASTAVPTSHEASGVKVSQPPAPQDAGDASFVCHCEAASVASQDEMSPLHFSLLTVYTLVSAWHTTSRVLTLTC